jgi:sarcosine oxidase/L-pipecolate oxidase
MPRTAVVLGAGICGVTAALELRRRGWRVVLRDPGPVPAPLAESNDVSKVVRADYGADETYAGMGERALDGWRGWQRGWDEELFHETGVTFVSRAPMAPGGFEHDSFALLTRRGHRLERLDAAAIAARFPAWRRGAFVDGYYNPSGGWVEAARVVARLAREARDAGVEIHENARAEEQEHERGDVRVVAAGAWTADLVPAVAGELRTVGQPVFHLEPSDPSLFEAPRFSVFGADIARTGWYGFPVTRGIVKVANHGVGRAMHPSSPARAVTPDEEAAMRAFVADTFPALATARLAATRTCVYCDTRDEHFWIAPDPAEPSLVVATGGSGHAFKFAPLLGGWIADAVEGRVVPRFRWRAGVAGARGEEAARHRA